MLVVFVAAKGKGCLWRPLMETQGGQPGGKPESGGPQGNALGMGGPVPRGLRAGLIQRQLQSGGNNFIMS